MEDGDAGSSCDIDDDISLTVTRTTSGSGSGLRTATSDLLLLPDGPHQGGPASSTAGRGSPSPDPFSVGELDTPVRPAFDFDGERWVETRRPPPHGGWRRLVWRLSLGLVNPGPDAHEQRRRRWIDEIRQPFGGTRTVAVVSTKGGVGKTTTALNLGHTLASIRGDRVVALDANPDAGSLAHRLPRRTEATAADLLREADRVLGYADMSRYTSTAGSNLEVVASPADPSMTRRLGRGAYERLLDVLRIHYNLVLADCGTGILDSATRGVVHSCDQLVVVTGPSVDAARAVSYLLAWLREHGMADLVSGAIVVVNGVRASRGPVDVEALVAHFTPQVHQVLTVPWDAELANGASVELDWLAPQTRHAYLQLAATLLHRIGAEHHDYPPGGNP